ncbi:MAG: UDP-N-acetylglucosamine:LPS N-acetylglucosamine transferase [Mucilaginibacter sp.]|nr:UDP-N-acetylglucosamine:LPS N-acetylglucosamine transferase [Mucilaginibacter sp.]
MLRPQLFLLRFLLAFTDFILLNLCLFAGFHFSAKYGFQFNHQSTFPALVTIWVSWFLSTNIFRLYSEYTVYKLQDIYKATWRSMVLHVALFSIYLLLTIHSGFPSYFIFIYSLFIISAFFFSRILCLAFMPLLNFDFNNRKANILAIASVGGHWIELLRIMPLFKEKDVTFISNKPSLKDTVRGYKFYTVPDANRDNKFNLIRCILSVFAFILFLRPQVIITTGAAPGLLGILIGRILGIKTIWIDSIANAEKLSLSGLIALRLADRVYTQWEHLANPKVVFSGNIL